jgi:hypothetical protein
MAGGPILPNSLFPGDTTGRLFPSFYGGAGGNAAARDEGMGVMASLSADATWELRFLLPPAAALPTGTLKLRLLALANAGAGDAKVTVKDAVVAAGASPSAVTLTSETQATLTWASGDNDKYKEAKITLSAVPVGNDILVVGLTFNTSGWTLAQVSTWIASIIWE